MSRVKLTVKKEYDEVPEEKKQRPSPPRGRAVSLGQESGGRRREVANPSEAERTFHSRSVFLEVGCVKVGDSRQPFAGSRISLTKDQRELASLRMLTTLTKSLQLKANKRLRNQMKTTDRMPSGKTSSFRRWST